MVEGFQLAAIAIVATVMCCIVRDHASSLAIALSVTACVVILCLSLQFLTPVLDVIKRLQELTGLSGTAVGPMLKVAGIGILTQLCGTVCEDAGEKTLQNAVQTGGTFLCLYASIPLFSSVLDLLEDMLTR